MESSEELRYAGDVSIDSVKIVTPAGFYQDITAQVLNIQFYEDIFAPFITGSISVKESFDLVNLFPFVGEEYVELDISTPSLEDAKIKGKYYIYKLTDRERIGEKNVVYQLHFISPEAIVDMNKKISKTFSGEIAKLVPAFYGDKNHGLESEKKVYMDSIKGKTKYISNFWSPVKNLRHLTTLATNSNDTPNYVFFENRDGFYFTSLESLYSNPPVFEFTHDNYSRDATANGGDSRNINEDFKRIVEIHIPTGYDYIDRLRTGMMASRQFSYDLTKKTYTDRSYTMSQRFSKQKHLNEYPINSDKLISRNNSVIINFPTNYGNFKGYGDVTNSKINQERISSMKMAEAMTIDIVVLGRTDYTAGQKVGVILYKAEPLTSKDDDNTDKIFSGYYIIAAINHVIDQGKHECHMQLIKDSSLIDMNGKAQ